MRLSFLSTGIIMFLLQPLGTENFILNTVHTLINSVWQLFINNLIQHSITLYGKDTRLCQLSSAPTHIPAVQLPGAVCVCVCVCERVHYLFVIDRCIRLCEHDKKFCLSHVNTT